MGCMFERETKYSGALKCYWMYSHSLHTQGFGQTLP